jgi:predicted GNAT family acetyltransferase
MLVAVHHADVDRFLEHAESFLLSNEAVHSLVLGLATDRTGRSGAVQHYTVADDGTTVLAAIDPRGIKLIVTDGPSAAARTLAELMASTAAPLPAVHSTAAVAEAFASRYAELRGGSAELAQHMRLHGARDVAELPMPTGRLRATASGDVDRVGQWLAEFERMLGERGPSDARGTFARLHGQGRLFVWEDGGEPRSMAAWTRPTATTVSVSFVFTPREFRGLGYATACVAALTRERLANGSRECLLFTDVANPISNAIYARIGYRARADFHEIRFGPARDGRSP